MKHNISKELFEAVYNCDITTDKDMLNVYKTINIYEFAFKCKEWAFDHFYLSIIIFKVKDNVYKCEIANISDYLGEWTTKYSFRADSEIEAIIKACEWILKYKGNQCTK